MSVKEQKERVGNMAKSEMLELILQKISEVEETQRLILNRALEDDFNDEECDLCENLQDEIEMDNTIIEQLEMQNEFFAHECDRLTEKIKKLKKKNKELKKENGKLKAELGYVL